VTSIFESAERLGNITKPKKLHHVSASQVEMYRRCQRLWFFSYVVGIKSPPSPAMQKGTDIHARQQHWGETGELPEENDLWYELTKLSVAALGIEWTPERAKDLHVERKLDMPTFDGGPLWTGFIDLLDTAGTDYADAEIIDYKTTSDFRYAKTPDEIRNNLQLMSYAKYVFEMEPQAEQVAVGHLYLRTKLPARVLFPTRQIVDRTHVDERWQSYVADVVEMTALAASPPPKATDVTPDTSHCNDYGGCYFRAECGVGGLKTLFQISSPKKENTNMVEGTISFSEKLKQRKLAMAGSTSVGTAPIASQAVAIEEPKAVAIEEPKASCDQCKGKKFYKAEGDDRFLMCKKCHGSDFAANGIVPPDAPARSTAEPSPGVVAALAAPNEAPADKKMRKKKEKPETAPEVPRAIPAPPMGSHTASVISIKVEGDDGQMVPFEIQNEAVVVEKLTKTVAVKEAKIAAKQTSARTKPAVAPTIYIDCLPLKGANAPMPFEEWLTPITDLLADEHNVPDYRMISYTSKGVLMAGIQQMLDTLPATLFVNSSYSGAEIFLEATIPHAAQVIRGFRG